MSRYGTCEIFFSPLSEQTSETCFWYAQDGEPTGEGWYYWCCFPGCLPEGEPIGPFETEKAAYDDAVIMGYIEEKKT